jgi:hypothetical protein
MSMGLSGSTVKSWFQYRCERKTRYELMDAAEQAAIPIVRRQKEKLWAILGDDYEARVVARLGRSVLLPAPGRRILSQEQSRAFLTGSRPQRYAAQVNLRPDSAPPMLAGSGVDVRQTSPDLVEIATVGGRRVFKIIDIKATRRSTAFHKTQVAFYVRMLEQVLREAGIEASMDPKGEIWHVPPGGTAEGDDHCVVEFDLEPYLRMVDRFCGEQVPAIARIPVGPRPSDDRTFFHVYFKCEQCDYLPHCSGSISAARSPDVRDVSAVAGVSHEAKRALLRNGVRSVADLAAAAGVGQRQGVGWTLQRRADQLRRRAQSLMDGVILRTEEEHTFLMPPRVDVSIFLLVDYDPVDDTLASIACMIRRDGTTRLHSEVLSRSDRAEEAEALCRIFTMIIEELAGIDAYNRSSGETGARPLTAHMFFFEPSEAVNLQQAIGRHLDDPRIRGGLLDIVRIFPPEDVVPEPEFRGAHHLPASSVRSVLEHLYALPVTVAYDLRQVSQVLAAVGAIALPYLPDVAFERPFSSMLGMEIIRGMRDARPDMPGEPEVRRDVEERLATLAAVTDWLHSEDQAIRTAGGPPMLRLNKKPFVFHQSFDPLNVVDLDVLRAMEVLESRAGLLDALVTLAQTAARRRDAGRCVAGLTMIGNTVTGFGTKARRKLTFSVPSESQASDLAPGDMGLVLTDDDPDVRLDPSAWPDCSVRMWRSGAEWVHRVTVDMSVADFDSPTFQRMFNRSGELPAWHIDKVFVDINGPRAADFIGALRDMDRT